MVLSQLSYSPTCAQASILADFPPRCQFAHIRTHPRALPQDARLGDASPQEGSPLGGTPPASCLPFVLQRGYPRERISYGSGVRSDFRAEREIVRKR